MEIIHISSSSRASIYTVVYSYNEISQSKEDGQTVPHKTRVKLINIMPNKKKIHTKGYVECDSI